MMVGNPSALLDELIKGDMQGNHSLMENINEIRDLLGEVMNNALDIINTDFMKGFKRFQKDKSTGKLNDPAKALHELINVIGIALEEKRKQRDNETRND
jgi:DNA-binding winged helix-turn-helix (wHTH) protein